MSKTNNVVNIGHNSNQLTDKLVDTLNKLGSAVELIDNARLQFERSCKGKIDIWDKKRMDAFEKVEWWQRGENTTKRAVSIIEEESAVIKSYLKANGVELEKVKND